MPSDDEANAAKIVLISDRVWRRTFGADPNILGREVNLDGTPRTIIGVMPKGFRFPTQTDLWIPAASFFAANNNRTWRADQAIARLKPGADRAAGAGGDVVDRGTSRDAIPGHEQGDRRGGRSAARTLDGRGEGIARRVVRGVRRRSRDRVRECRAVAARARQLTAARTTR